MQKIKIFILDDHKIIRDGLRSILALRSQYLVVGEESNPLKFMGQLDSTDFDILLLDISFPEASGIDLIYKIKSQKPKAFIVMLSMHDNVEIMGKCYRAGANAYVPKTADADELLKVLEVVMEKEYFYPVDMENRINLVTQVPEGTPSPISAREREVLIFLANGLSSKQIAEKLRLSARTVDTHRLNIMKKLGTSNSAETVLMATKLKLLDA